EGGRRAGSPSTSRPEILRSLSPTLANDFEVLCKVATSRLPVMLLCEPGSGAGKIATAVHGLSGRTGPLAVIAAGAPTPTAVLDGEVEDATLFVEQVADLSPSLQLALLRLLQHGGSADQVLRDRVPRVVATTARDLGFFTGESGLRRDLYARLRAYQLRV